MALQETSQTELKPSLMFIQLVNGRLVGKVFLNSELSSIEVQHLQFPKLILEKKQLDIWKLSGRSWTGFWHIFIRTNSVFHIPHDDFHLYVIEERWMQARDFEEVTSEPVIAANPKLDTVFEEAKKKLEVFLIPKALSAAIYLTFSNHFKDNFEFSFRLIQKEFSELRFRLSDNDDGVSSCETCIFVIDAYFFDSSVRIAEFKAAFLKKRLVHVFLIIAREKFWSFCSELSIMEGMHSNFIESTKQDIIERICFLLKKLRFGKDSLLEGRLVDISPMAKPAVIESLEE
jgi:hypothetical protein